jgi:acyl-coenzyme A synthetase/AMP-(fatty) acid ligase
MVDFELESLRGLRYLLAGGDVLSPSHVAKAAQELKGCRIVNGYGPTENTTFTCCYTVPRDFTGNRAVPIGKPITNTHVYVLDEHLRPVPPGIPGELYAAGQGVAIGYLNQAELTASKFISSPFRACEQLYRTGDFARWCPDGNLEFLGRIDQQVKVRGHRVEPGEIEATLKQHPGITEACVMSMPDSSLAAFVVQREHPVDDSNLRAFLEARLPAYMVPGLISILASLPVTANGKVDRSFVVPHGHRPESLPREEPGAAGPVEQSLLDIWREVLKGKDFGTRDNFFHLGGPLSPRDSDYGQDRARTPG